MRVFHIGIHNTRRPGTEALNDLCSDTNGAFSVSEIRSGGDFMLITKPRIFIQFFLAINETSKINFYPFVFVL